MEAMRRALTITMIKLKCSRSLPNLVSERAKWISNVLNYIFAFGFMRCGREAERT